MFKLADGEGIRTGLCSSIGATLLPSGVHRWVHHSARSSGADVIQLCGSCGHLTT